MGTNELPTEETNANIAELQEDIAANVTNLRASRRTNLLGISAVNLLIVGTSGVVIAMLVFTPPIRRFAYLALASIIHLAPGSTA